MQKYMLSLLLLLAATLLSGQTVLSCYDIQYTMEADGNSLYLGEQVTVQGVVTGTGFNNTRYYISDAQGGPWSGLFIYNNTNLPALGDLVQLTGTVDEYYNLTEITSVTAFQILSHNNPLPAPSIISTGSLSSYVTGEQWESVLVQVQSATVTVNPNAYQEFMVTDGSGNCQIDNGFFPSSHNWTNIQIGVSFASITGIVDYNFNYYGINPRSLNDMVLTDGTLTLYLPNLTTSIESMITVPLEAHNVYPADGYQSYAFNLNYDPAILNYQYVNKVGTLSHTGTVNVDSSAGNLNISYNSSTNLSGNGVLLNIIFLAANTGISNLNLYNSVFGSDPVTHVVNGSVTVNGNYNTLGDTLTVIQRPILNVPAIHIPGETMTVTCLAAQNTTGFNGYLLHGNKRVNLPLVSSAWLVSPNRWELQFTVPQVPVFELYDLEINANGGIHDVSQNAVQLIPTRKTNYYFIHISDLHMPTRYYYPNAGYDIDSTSVLDFRAVMDDINLVRPEFVLLTGDLINEGELENFSGQFWYGWVQRIISELEVPVYVTAGNHDLGGWDDTPPPQGSSRRNWWRYFGWSWLDNPAVAWPYHTQDYYFTYNNTLFIGLESYDNYDSFRLNIYGYESFTDQQMAWLNSTVNTYPNYTKVLFHHYDFQDELNLSALDIDMSLWGHIHTNYGSLTTYPYSLATRSTCDGNRGYRVIRVNNDTLTPYATSYAGTIGSTINISYAPSNTATADSVLAVITNGQALSFENTLVKFNMPAGDTGYIVTNGNLEQVDRSGDHNVCYVRVNLGAQAVKYVSIKANGVANEDAVLIPAPLRIKGVFPNPLPGAGELELESDKAISSITIELYNLKGQKVQDFGFNNLIAGTNRLPISTKLSSGIYFVKIKDQAAKAQKLVIAK